MANDEQIDLDALIAEAREGLHSVHERDLIRHLADALEAVAAQRDWHALQEAGLRDDIGNLEAERDEARHWAETMQAQKFEARIERNHLHKAITEALAFESVLPAIATEPRRILRAALDKEGNDDGRV